MPVPVFRDSLSGWRNPFAGNPLQKPERLEKAVTEIRKKLGEVTPKEPDPYSLQKTYQELKLAASSGAAIARLTARQVRLAPWVMFEPQENGAEPLAEGTIFLKSYLARLREIGSTSAILALARCFLQFYPHDKRYFGFLLRNITELLPLATTARGRRFRERAETFGLLSADGPKRFARILFESSTSPDTLLNEAGLTGQLFNKGFIEHAYGEMLKMARMGLESDTWESLQLERLLEFSVPVDFNGSGFRFPRQRVQLAHALLLPFVNAVAGSTHKQLVRDFVLSRFGDLRLDLKHWHGISEEARSVMLRWLVENTLEDFFRLLGYSARHDPDADRQWPFRRAFWEAYLRAGYISDAWVVLGEQAAVDATRFLSQQAATYGRLTRGYNVRPSHSVLLMRIGDLVITEWSHMGKYRIWHTNSRDVPKFYRSHYNRDDVVKLPNFEGSHMSADTGSWQGKVSDHIRAQTGISMGYRQYMPQL